MYISFLDADGIITDYTFFAAVHTILIYILFSNILDIMKVERVTSLQYFGVGNQE